MLALYPKVLVKLDLIKLEFVEGTKTQRKTLGARREPTTNSTHIWHPAGIEPGRHQREASALTTAHPCLAPLESVSFGSPRLSVNIEVEGENTHCFPRGQTLIVLLHLPTQKQETITKLSKSRLLDASTQICRGFKEHDLIACDFILLFLQGVYEF